jgi:hypothetical protein
MPWWHHQCLRKFRPRRSGVFTCSIWQVALQLNLLVSTGPKVSELCNQVLLSQSRRFLLTTLTDCILTLWETAFCYWKANLEWELWASSLDALTLPPSPQKEHKAVFKWGWWSRIDCWASFTTKQNHWNQHKVHQSTLCLWSLLLRQCWDYLWHSMTMCEAFCHPVVVTLSPCRRHGHCGTTLGRRQLIQTTVWQRFIEVLRDSTNSTNSLRQLQIFFSPFLSGESAVYQKDITDVMM